MKSISIVIPLHNREELIVQTLDSLLDQTNKNWEAIVVDDGSTDGSLKVAQNYAKKDSRIRVIERRSYGKPGADAARNLGWRAARSDFIIFLDSDDLLGANAVEQRLQATQNHTNQDFWVFPSMLFHENAGDSDVIWNIDRQDVDDLDRVLALDMPWSTNGVLWTKALLEKLDGWDEDLPSWQDFDINIRALAEGARYVKVDAEVDNYWRTPAGESIGVKSVGREHMLSHQRLLNKLTKILAANGLLTTERRISIGGIYFFLIKIWLDIHNDRREARTFCRIARLLKLFTAKQFIDCRIFIALHRWRPLAILWRKYITLTWPKVAIDKYSKTFRQLTNADLV